MARELGGISVARPALVFTGHTNAMRYPLLAAVVLLPLVSGCVRANPPTDTGDPIVSTPTAPSGGTTAPSPTTPTGATTPLGYTQDMKVLFQSDCVSCHGASRADGNYRMTTYQQVMAAVVPGSPGSLLVRDTQSGGSMYRYWSGSTATRQSKAAQVRSWVVTYNAQENR